MKKVLQASKFPSRQHLDAHMQTLKKSFEYTIEGSKDELARLKLSSTTTVFGAVCVETSKVKGITKQNFAKPDRGPRFVSGINLAPEKRKKLEKVEEKKVVKKARKLIRPKKK